MKRSVRRNARSRDGGSKDPNDEILEQVRCSGGKDADCEFTGRKMLSLELFPILI